MVRFLLEAGADQEHKVIHIVINFNSIKFILIVQTDEMHTALMEASMDGHVEVARLLLDSGAQVRKYLNHHKNIWLLCELLSGDSVQYCSAPRHAMARVSNCLKKKLFSAFIISHSLAMNRSYFLAPLLLNLCNESTEPLLLPPNVKLSLI